MKLFPGFNHERKEKSSIKKEFFCCEHSYIYSSMYPSKDEYSVRFRHYSANIMCKYSRQKPRGNGLSM